MGRLALKNVCEKRGKGKVRLYFRRKVGGKDEYLRLPDFDDPRFSEEYQRLSAPEQVKPRPKAGTLGALVSTFRASSDYTNIKSDATRRNRTRYLSMIEEEHGHRSVVGCFARDIRVMRDAYASKPGKANNWLATFKVLMAYAEKNGWRNDNPTFGVEMLDIGEHEPWPSHVLDEAIELATPMTRLAIITGLCTGVRIGDAVRLRHDWIEAGIIAFKTSKNKTDVAAPIHPLWLAEIEKLPKVCETILYDRSNTPFSNAKALRGRIHALMEQMGRTCYISNGVEKVYSFHGLRKNAACYFAELGVNDSDIGSICGMTPETVRHYTKRARSLMIARRLAEKITRGDVLPSEGGRN
jgi:Phage integrase family